MELLPFVLVLAVVAAVGYFLVLPAIRKARPNTPGFFGGGGRGNEKPPRIDLQ